MDAYGPETYGDRVADQYDGWYGPMPQAAIDVLEELSAGGPALELGIGTGRAALPLSARGVPVTGIDASTRMLDRLSSKDGGGAIDVVVGDFADVDVDGSFSLVYVVFNTFFGLLTQEDQVRCFANVAAHLVPGGAFVMEAFVPDLTRFDRGQRVSVSKIDQSGIRLDVAMHDVATQRVTSNHLLLGDDGVRTYPIEIRFAYPSELDLMARLAGLELQHRWADWDKTPMSSSAGLHVSTWRKPD